MHIAPVPRGGGIGILLGVMVGALALGVSFVDWSVRLAVTGSVLLVIIALWDDRKSAPPFYRLVIQVFAASCLLAALYYQLPGTIDPLPLWKILLLSLALVLAIVWSVNLYNFMDGMDGLAAVMAIIGFGCLAWFGWHGGEMMYASMVLIIAAACAGFLPFNLHPAKMFMGDVGSTLLGFWVAGFSLWGLVLTLYPWWVPLLIFSPFWVDATVTLVSRVLKREKIFQAHQSHAYQRLVKSGFRQNRTLLLETALMLMCAFFAVRMTMTV
jgi:UDP-N-acetylmuramyl pentapeptide phosphotransferase/UDP-N-acetylglucosamine-1-phosphate transferase